MSPDDIAALALLHAWGCTWHLGDDGQLRIGVPPELSFGPVRQLAEAHVAALLADARAATDREDA